MELALEAAPVGNIQQEVDIRGSLQFLDSRLRLGQLGPEPANGPLGVIGRRPASRGDAGGLRRLAARLGAALRAAAPVLRRFAGPGAVALVFFFMGIPDHFKACRNSPRQDSPFQTPCHGMARPWPDLGPPL